MEEARSVGPLNRPEVLDVVLGAQLQEPTVEALGFGQLTVDEGLHGNSPQVVRHEVQAPTRSSALGLVRNNNGSVSVAPREPRLSHLLEATTIGRTFYGVGQQEVVPGAQDLVVGSDEEPQVSLYEVQSPQLSASFCPQALISQASGQKVQHVITLDESNYSVGQCRCLGHSSVSAQTVDTPKGPRVVEAELEVFPQGLNQGEPTQSSYTYVIFLTGISPFSMRVASFDWDVLVRQDGRQLTADKRGVDHWSWLVRGDEPPHSGRYPESVTHALMACIFGAG